MCPVTPVGFWRPWGSLFESVCGALERDDRAVRRLFGLFHVARRRTGKAPETVPVTTAPAVPLTFGECAATLRGFG